MPLDLFCYLVCRHNRGLQVLDGLLYIDHYQTKSCTNNDLHIEVVYPAWIPENIYSIYVFQTEKLLAPADRAQNFTYSGVKTQKCQNFQIDHYNSKRLS